MRVIDRGRLKKMRAKQATKGLVAVPSMRNHADMSRRQLRTSNYNQAARDRLAAAVEQARIAAGYRYRTEFCRAHGIKNLRGLELLEAGKTGVGQAFLFELARALPGWTEDTPRQVLEGEEPPVGDPASQRLDRLVSEVGADRDDVELALLLIDHDWTNADIRKALDRRKARRRDQLPVEQPTETEPSRTETPGPQLGETGTE